MPGLAWRIQEAAIQDGGHSLHHHGDGPRGPSSWRPSKFERVGYNQYVRQIWCFWKNLNQTLRALPYHP